MLSGQHLPPGITAPDRSLHGAAAREALPLSSVPPAEALQLSAVNPYKTEVQFSAVAVAVERAVGLYPGAAALEAVQYSAVSPARARAQPRAAAAAVERVATASAAALPHADNY